MIIWINGTFGVGKTTTARELLALRADARFWDPEYVGFMLQPLLQDLPVTNFQHWPAWREIVVATGAALSRQTDQHLIAPQSVLNADYMREIREGLTAAGEKLFEVVLDISEPVLRARIAGDSVESEGCRDWRTDHIAAYFESRSWMVQTADLVVDTSALSPADVAQRVADAAWSENSAPGHP